MTAWACVKGKMRPVMEATYITHGKKKGHWKVLLPDGKKKIVKKILI